MNRFQRLLKGLALPLMLLVVMAGDVAAQGQVDLIAGRARSIDAPRGKRISDVRSSNTGVVSGQVLSNDREVKIVGVAAGSATLTIFYTDGRDEDYLVRVHRFDLKEKIAVLRDMLAMVEDIEIRQVDEIIVVEGMIGTNREWERYRKVMDMLGEGVVDLVDNNARQNNIQIDAEIAEISTGDLKDLGIDWNDQSGSNIQFGERGSGDETFSAEVWEGTAGGTVKAVDRLTSLTATLKLLVETGRARLLANPSAVCRSNAEAKFNVGGEVPILTSDINRTTVDYKPYGVILNVTPVLESVQTKMIRLRVQAEVSQVDFSVSVGGVPGFLSRNAETELLVRSGETIAIAGLVASSVEKKERRLPILGRIPILGGLLFGTTSTNVVERETLILLTPKLVASGRGDNIEFDRPATEARGAELDKRAGQL